LTLKMCWNTQNYYLQPVSLCFGGSGLPSQRRDWMNSRHCFWWAALHSGIT